MSEMVAINLEKMSSIANVLMKLWVSWNIRGLIVLSLLVQSFLVLFAPLRKQKGGKWVFMTSMWFAYLLADWVATFTIGLILRSERSFILVFWAPFLLLHLGGPDTITSFSLEDNEFWIRHLLGFVLQIASTAYVILHSPPHNQLLFPALLMLIAGIIKYAERNRAFYLASFEHYGDRGKAFSYQREVEDSLHPGTRKELVAPYGIIKNLLVGPLLTPKYRLSTRQRLDGKGPEQVLQMIEIELSLLYEALHTKLPVVHSKIGYILRFISLGCIFGALLSFRLIPQQPKLRHFDVWITYGLLISAITLDFISIGMLIFSDFNLAYYNLKGSTNVKIMAWIHNRVINRRRWSKIIPQHNFITYCLNDYPDWLLKLADFLYLRTFLEAIKKRLWLSSQELKSQMWNFIFEQVETMALSAETVEMGKEICLRRGNGILDSHEKYRELLWTVKELDYTESLVTWHIATEFCFHDEDYCNSSDNMGYRKISKSLSDYMFYLLEMEHAIMGTVSMDQKVVREATYYQIKSFINGQSSWDGKNVSRAIFALNPELDFMSPIGRKPVFLYARKLAHQLKELDESNGFPWELMSKVWVELMCHAASNCRANVHAQQPSRGGQLLTIIWLLMNWFGLGTQFATGFRDVV